MKKNASRAPRGENKNQKPLRRENRRPAGPAPAKRSENRNGPLICWGRNPVSELLSATPERVSKLLVARGLEPAFLDKLTRMAGVGGIKPQFVPREHLDKLSENGTHQGVLAYVTAPKAKDLDDVVDGVTGAALVVALDHVQDPRNLGAIARTAEAAGATAIVVPENRSATLTGTVVKTSAGAALRLPIVTVVNLRRSLEELKKRDFWVVGLSGDAEVSLFDEKLPDRCVLVAGAEGQGLSELTRKTCDMVVKLPMCKPTESLNAAVATGLATYQWALAHKFNSAFLETPVYRDDYAPELNYRAPELELNLPEEEDWEDD